MPMDAEHVGQIHLRYMRNAGQGCASPTRILVPEERHDEFVEASRRVFATVPVGDPWDPATVVGPLIRPEHRDRVEGFVERAVARRRDDPRRRRTAGPRARLVREPDAHRRRRIRLPRSRRRRSSGPSPCCFPIATSTHAVAHRQRHALRPCGLRPRRRGRCARAAPRGCAPAASTSTAEAASGPTRRSVAGAPAASGASGAPRASGSTSSPSTSNGGPRRCRRRSSS